MLNARNVEDLSVLLETIPDAGMRPLIFHEFVHEVFDGGGEGLVEILAISVDVDLLVEEGGLVAIKRYLLDVLG